MNRCQRSSLAASTAVQAWRPTWTARLDETGHVRFYAQFKVRNGKVIYIFDHEDRAAALEAAGLSI